MAYSPSLSPASRRRKRRRNLIVLTIVAVIVGVVYGVLRASGERELTRSYLDVSYRVASGEADAAATLIDIVVNLEDLETKADSFAIILESAEPPVDLLRAHDFLQIATSSWRSGMSEPR